MLALFGVLALLVAGTHILNWYWPVALFGVGLAVGGYRLRNRVANGYRLLQVVDRRLDLSDALSTAHFFAEDPSSGAVSEEVRRKQRELAEALCGEADMRKALPFRFPRRAYVTGALALIAVTTLGLRYGVLRTLDLGPPITESLFEFYRPTTLAAMETIAEPPLPEYEPPDGAVEGSELPESDSARANPEVPLSEGLSSLDPLPPGLEGTASGDELFDPDLNSGDEGDDSEWSDAATGDRAEGDEEGAAGEQGEAGEDEEMPSLPAPEDPDLFNQLQDAFANLMSRLKAPESANNRLVPDEDGDEKQPGEGEGDSQSQQVASSTQPGGTPISSEGYEDREPVDISEEAPMSGDAGSEEGGQGIAGSSEGDKDIRMAEQLEAMGKLSEIIGQRAESITGEMMVEVSSGDQSLETAYTESAAAHRSAGGGIHRDEVPLELRDYVQAYFEEVRKQPESSQ